MIVFLWLLLSMGVAFGARQRNRSAGFWFILSVVLSPLVGAIALITANRYGWRFVRP